MRWIHESFKQWFEGARMVASHLCALCRCRSPRWTARKHCGYGEDAGQCPSVRSSYQTAFYAMWSAAKEPLTFRLNANQSQAFGDAVYDALRHVVVMEVTIKMAFIIRA